MTSYETDQKNTWATPWESLRITPIWEGVRPFLANLKIWSLTSSLVIFSHWGTDLWKNAF